MAQKFYTRTREQIAASSEGHMAFWKFYTENTARINAYARDRGTCRLLAVARYLNMHGYELRYEYNKSDEAWVCLDNAKAVLDYLK